MSTKNDVLAILDKRRGEFVSGQELAAALKVSRSAIWKAVRALEESGWEVRAVRNRGYQLSGGGDVLSGESVRAFLQEPFSHCKVIFSERVDSTNTLAKRLSAEEAPHGTIIVANEQTAGRGRGGKSFYSPSGTGLYLSVVLRPREIPPRPQMITVGAAVSVCRAIGNQTSRLPGIKWVNDILIDGKKVCGILTEAVSDFESGGIDCIVVGAGINCLPPSEGAFPDEISGVAGALNIPGLLRAKLAADISSGILDAFKNLEDKALVEEYRRRSVMLGRRVSFEYSGRRVYATVLGLDDDCGLVVALEDGAQMTLRAGEVSISEGFY